jgi:hypothetical protein
MPGVWLEELMAQGIIRGEEDLYKISGNIAAGAYVLATYLSETNDLRQALNRYVGSFLVCDQGLAGAEKNRAGMAWRTAACSCSRSELKDC